MALWPGTPCCYDLWDSSRHWFSKARVSVAPALLQEPKPIPRVRSRVGRVPRKLPVSSTGHLLCECIHVGQ